MAPTCLGRRIAVEAQRAMASRTAAKLRVDACRAAVEELERGHLPIWCRVVARDLNGREPRAASATIEGPHIIPSKKGLPCRSEPQ